MKVLKISIERFGKHGYATNSVDDPLRASVTVAGENVQTVIQLDDQASENMVRLIADEIAKAGKRVLEHMTAQAIETAADLPPAIEHKQTGNEYIEPSDLDDGMPF